jgi:hypothetical protein
MVSLKHVLCALSCLVLLACSDDGKSAPEKCDDLVSDLCARAVDCVGGGSEQDCIEEIGTVLACGQADGVSGTYNRCIDQVNTNACENLFPADASGQPELVLPADCEEVILFK